MQFLVRTEKSRSNLRKGTVRTMFRTRVDEKQSSREGCVAISKSYDIVSPLSGEFREHFHSRKGLSIAEDCHFAAFSNAQMQLRPARTNQPPTATPQPDQASRQLAEMVVARGMQLVDIVASEVGKDFDCLDKKWSPSLPDNPCNTSMLAWMLGGLKMLCQATEDVLRSQPIVSVVEAPAKVFGDVHGQLRDLLLLFHYYGRPGSEAIVGGQVQRSASAWPQRTSSRLSRVRSLSRTGASDLGLSVSRTSTVELPMANSASLSEDSDSESAISSLRSVDPRKAPISYVFNGDWVDRGRHQLEVVILLFALKVVNPSTIWLNRGNHEDAGQNLKTSKKGSLGFDRACATALGPVAGAAAFAEFHRVFNWLPLAACIADQILVLHGGLGGGEWTLNQLRSVERPLHSNDLAGALGGAVYNVLWSDPLAPDQKDPLKTYGVHPSHRSKHSSVMKGFGRDITERFCAREQLGMIIRSHQFKASGKGYEIQHDGWLMRVFSARNYCGESCNDGGLLLIGFAGASPGTLLVRPQNIERLPKRKLGDVDAAIGEPMAEPYCQRGHLMQLVEPRPPKGLFSLSLICRDRDVNVECNKCGAEELQLGHFYNCRGCGHYDLCLGCAGSLARSDAHGLRAGAGRLPRYRPERGDCAGEASEVDSCDSDADSSEGGDSDIGELVSEIFCVDQTCEDQVGPTLLTNRPQELSSKSASCSNK